MISTESKLWQHLVGEVEHQEPDAAFHRFESPITPGASDVHYVTAHWCGWIELKTAAWPRGKDPLRLHSPFTLAQATWSLNHHAPQRHLRSWLLVGIIGPRTWKGFVLCNPANAVQLLNVRSSMPLQRFLLRVGVYHHVSIVDVVLRIRSRI